MTTNGAATMSQPTSSKFDSAITEYLHLRSLDGGCDEESGEVDRAGWFGRFDGSLDPLPDDERASELDADDIETLGSAAGAILTEDGQGFVYSEVFTDDALLKERWEEVISWDDDDESEDDE